ncbi:MAG: glycosyl hydrolase family 65 protein [Longimicrobiales bacterium]
MTEWLLIYDEYDPDEEGLREALCTTGNGVFATRGAAPECAADDVHYPGTYRIGLYDRQETTIEGTTVPNESLVNLPNWLHFRFRIEDGEWFTPDAGDLVDYEQRFDAREGLLSRHLQFRHDDRVTSVTQRRFVSMADPHMGALETTFKAENWSGRLEVRSGIDGNVENGGVERYRQLESRHLDVLETRELDDGESLLLLAETRQSRIRIAEAVRTCVHRDEHAVEVERERVEGEGRIAHGMTVELAEDEAVTFEKVLTLYTSLDRAVSECGLEARRHLEAAPRFSELLRRHILAWSQYWRRSEIRIGTDEHTDRAVNLYLCHTLQTVSDNTVGHDVGVPARGIHGEAYRGHVFWDELFVFPVLDFRLPELTRSLLKYRYHRLPAARRAAAEAGYEGAMFPWQSGSSGREETQTLHLNPRSGRWVPDNTHLQRHINVAIPYSIWKHYQATGDLELLAFYGAEMILETARFWASITEYNRARDRYEINGVLGPDEFHTRYPGADEPGLDNNAYTNVMVVWVLLRALELTDVLPGRRRELLWEKLGIQRMELELWEDITRKMFVPFHDDDRIISQFQGYRDLNELDWADYRDRYDDIQRLDRILEAEDDDINRYKASKQADVLMLFFLLSSDELAGIFHRLRYPFDRETMARNTDYYMERTSHGSTLSGVVHAWVLARTDRDRAWEFFRRALESDISDIQGGTTPEGIHLGAMTGTVDLLQRCYTGMEARGDRLRFDPRIPEDLDELHFTIQYRSNWLDIDLCRDHITIHAQPSSAAAVDVEVNGERRTVSPGSRVRFERELPEDADTD